MSRRFLVWNKCDSEASAEEFEAYDHRAAVEAACEKWDDFEVQERELYVREIVDDPDEQDDEHDRKRGDAVLFDGTAEYSKSWAACEAYVPPPEPEEKRLAREAEWAARQAEHDETNARNRALIAVAWIGRAIHDAVTLRERLAHAGLTDAQMVALLDGVHIVREIEWMGWQTKDGAK